jgi:hypothetical protein
MTNPPQAKDIFLQALDKDSPAQRRKYLDEACGDDVNLRRRVDALLEAHDEPESYLDRPAIQLSSRLGTDTDV